MFQYINNYLENNYFQMLQVTNLFVNIKLE